MAIARLSLLKSILLLDESTADNDTAYKLALAQAGKFADRHCHRTLELTEYEDELYSSCQAQDYGRNLYPRNWPLTEVAALKVWDSASQSFVTLSSADYELIEERYIRYPKLGRESVSAYGSFPSGPENNIKLSYTAGYDGDTWDSAALDDVFGVPEDLEMAVAQLAAFMIQKGPRAGIAAESMGPRSITYSDPLKNGGSIPVEIAAALGPYMRLRL